MVKNKAIVYFLLHLLGLSLSCGLANAEEEMLLKNSISQLVSSFDCVDRKRFYEEQVVEEYFEIIASCQHYFERPNIPILVPDFTVGMAEYDLLPSSSDDQLERKLMDVLGNLFGAKIDSFDLILACGSNLDIQGRCLILFESDISIQNKPYSISGKLSPTEIDNKFRFFLPCIFYQLHCPLGVDGEHDIFKIGLHTSRQKSSLGMMSRYSQKLK